MNAWIAVALAGVGSFAFRLGAVLVIDRLELPVWFDRVSKLVTPAVFAGLAAGSLAAPIGDGLATALPVIAGAVATAATALRRTAATAVLIGMTVLVAARGLGEALGS